MRASALIPGQYLKAADLQGRDVVVTISHIKMEKIDNKDRPILYFDGKERGLALNKTNLNNIIHLYGDETDNWRGAQITLYEAMVDYQGRSTPAIRVKPPQRHASPISTAPQRQIGGISDNMDRVPPANHPINDDIPF